MINAKPRNAIEINQLASALHSAEARGVSVERLSGSDGVNIYPANKHVQVDVWCAVSTTVTVNDLCAALNNLN